MLQNLDNNIKTLTYVTRILVTLEKNFIIPLIFANYIRMKLLALIKMKLSLKSIPDEVFQMSLKTYSSIYQSEENYVDTYSCVIVNDELVKNESETIWYYICNLSSLKKYKITIYKTSKVGRNEILISDTMKFNIQNYLNVSDFQSDRYFIIAASDTENSIAEEVGISLIENPNDCTEEFVNGLLKNYFSSAKYLRVNDVLSIDIGKFTPRYRHIISRNNCGYVLFKIVYINVDKLSQSNPRKGSFVVKGLTTLIQKKNINCYSPPRISVISNQKTREDDINFHQILNGLLNNCPPALEDSLKSLMDCIYPFTKREIFVNVRPVFLIKGARGSGKSSLVRIAAQRMGLNLINVDLSEVQSLTSAQTEAKLRIILHNASKCVPSILLLTNIQIFGKDAEGKEDERIISSFDTELNNFCKPGTKFPLIVIATSNNSLLPASLDKVFIDTIEIKDLTKNQRYESLKWLLAIRGIEYDADLNHVAAFCNDFLLADLNAIILHAAKIKEFHSNSEKRILNQEEFEKANEYMQSRYSDWMGVPRIPKVHWEDIGGLADLKNEILRRIELPLMTSDDLGLRRSGVLLYGPPGTGKTLLAKAVATECQVNFLSVKGPELLNMYVGQSEKNVREVFARARSSSPCVIFFDELDSLAPNRGNSGDSGGVMDRVVSQLLSEIDGVESYSGSSVFIIGATNRPDLIDPALLRPGRFDKLLYVGISTDKKSKISIIRALTRKFQFKENNENYIKKLIEDIVEYLPENLTGADLYAVCSDAWLSAIRRYINEKSNFILHEEKENFKNNIVIVEKDDFINSAKNVSPSVNKEELIRYEKLKNEFG